MLPVTGPNHASVAVGGLLFRFVCDSVALPSALPSALPWLHPLLLAIATTDIRFCCSHSDLLFIFCIFPLLASSLLPSLHLLLLAPSRLLLLLLGLAPLSHTNDRPQSKTKTALTLPTGQLSPNLGTSRHPCISFRYFVIISLSTLYSLQCCLSSPLLAQPIFALSHQLPQLHLIRPTLLCICWHPSSCGGWTIHLRAVR